MAINNERRTRDKIAALRAENPEISAGDIASKIGVSRERVRQILVSLGLPTKIERILSDDVKSDPAIAKIKARLRQLPEVLGKTDTEIAELCGISSSHWSNYKSVATKVTVTWEVALVLWNAFGIPLEWIYGGETSLVPDPAMREKLAIANRKAEAWLASRSPPH